MVEFSVYVAFNNATNEQTDIKHKMGGKNNLNSMSLLKIAVEKLFNFGSFLTSCVVILLVTLAVNSCI